MHLPSTELIIEVQFSHYERDIGIRNIRIAIKKGKNPPRNSWLSTGYRSGETNQAHDALPQQLKYASTGAL